MKKYDPKKIEAKWQKQWLSKKIFAAKDNSKQKKKFVLVEFPFPSGSSLHMGHLRPYTAGDIVSKYHKMKGENVVYPIGWDAFGLPAENFAIKNKVHPEISTKKNVANAKRQLQNWGIGFDWSREINTTDPKYYKWTQKIFLEFLKAGLAYEKTGLINWCPVDKTGLANEEVIDGKCERCGSVVEKKELRQWYLKITDYAEKLLDGLKHLPEWPEAIKLQQENWIGKSEGAEIEFKIQNSESKISIFTTRPDTIFGATYLVLAPESKIVKNLESRIQNLDDVKNYIEKSKNESDIDRTAEGKEKTGVELEGVKAINPANNKEIPIWIADYVLGSYGTGAIMAVPAHDERDFAFAKKFNLPIERVIEPKFINTSDDSAVKQGEEFVKRDAVCVVVKNPANNKYLCIKWKNVHMNGLVTGGIEKGEDLVSAAKREVKEETGLRNLKLTIKSDFAIHSLFYHRIKKQNRWARFQYVFLELENEQKDIIKPEEEVLHEVVWKNANEFKDFFSVVEGEFITNLINNKDYIFTGNGILNNSEKFNDLDSEDAKKKITEFVGGKLVTKYKLRDWVFSRQRYWGEPIPVIHCEKCGVVPVPDKDLPVVLPKVKNYEPTGTGESPLAGIDKWVNTKCPICKGKAKRETNTMPQWAGSSWYWLRYCDPKNTKEFADIKKIKYWTPVDLYFGGMEHTTLHLLYSRFWNQFLFDRGLVATKEPFIKRVPHGIILGPDGEKMSKSRGNVVNPDNIAKVYGVDTMRLYMAFLGPHGNQIAWNDKGIIGTRRFIERVFSATEFLSKNEPREVTTAINKTIKKIGEDIENTSFNTAVSALMICLNSVYEHKKITLKSFEKFLQILAPLAPHISEEQWNKIGNKKSIFLSKWPKIDEKFLIEDVSIAIQINGKAREVMKLPKDTLEAQMVEKARTTGSISERLSGKTIVKTIAVKNRIVNFVVKE